MDCDHDYDSDGSSTTIVDGYSLDPPSDASPERDVAPPKNPSPTAPQQVHAVPSLLVHRGFCGTDLYRRALGAGALSTQPRTEQNTQTARQGIPFSYSGQTNDTSEAGLAAQLKALEGETGRLRELVDAQNTRATRLRDEVEEMAQYGLRMEWRAQCEEAKRWAAEERRGEAEKMRGEAEKMREEAEKKLEQARRYYELSRGEKETEEGLGESMFAPFMLQEPTEMEVKEARDKLLVLALAFGLGTVIWLAGAYVLL